MASGIGRVSKVFNQQAKAAAKEVAKAANKEEQSAKKTIDTVKKVVSQVPSVTRDMATNYVTTRTQAFRRDLEGAGAALNKLKPELARLEVSIKEVITQIEAVRKGEKEEQERLKDSQQTGTKVMENLQKAADSLAELRKSLLSL